MAGSGRIGLEAIAAHRRLPRKELASSVLRRRCAAMAGLARWNTLSRCKSPARPSHQTTLGTEPRPGRRSARYAIIRVRALFVQAKGMPSRETGSQRAGETAGRARKASPNTRTEEESAAPGGAPGRTPAGPLRLIRPATSQSDQVDRNAPMTRGNVSNARLSGMVSTSLRCPIRHLGVPQRSATSAPQSGTSALPAFRPAFSLHRRPVRAFSLDPEFMVPYGFPDSQ